MEDLNPDFKPAHSEVKMEHHSEDSSPMSTAARKDEEMETESSEHPHAAAGTKKRPRSPSEGAELAEDILDKKNRVLCEGAQNSGDVEASQHTVEPRQPSLHLSDSPRSCKDDVDSLNSATQPVPSPPRVLSADLIAAILGSAPASRSAPIAVPIPSPELAVKKKKAKAPPVKVFKAVKEIKEATALLHGKVDLTKILSEEECRFLGEQLWIVTTQQLENVLHPQTEGHTNARQELIEKLAVSTLVTNNSDIPSIPEDVASKIDVRNNEGGATPTESQIGVEPRGEGDSLALTGSETTNQTTLREQDISFTLLVKEEDKGPESIAASFHAPSDTLTEMTETGMECSEFSPSVLDVSGVVDVASEVHNIEAHSIGTNMNGVSPRVATTTTVDDFGAVVTKAGGGSETVSTQSSALADEPDTRTLRQAAQPKDQNISHSSLASRDACGGGGNDSFVADSGSAAAMRVMESWDQKLRKRHDSQISGDSTKQFFLDGPVSFVIPQCTRNFLKSTKIETVFEFLSLKRTETGVILDVYAEWRKKCALAECPRSTIAKHLVAIGARFEALIGSSCPLPSPERRWLGGHMIVLGGSAKDFLVYMGVLDSHLFLTTTTKELSNKLAKWRIKKGLEPLKGTGKVAMVSAWKTQIREALDLELNTGQVLSDDWMKPLNMHESEPLPLKKRPSKKLLSLPQTNVESVDKPAQSVGKKASTSSRSSLLESADQTLENELSSNDLLHSIFAKDVVDVMASIGILSGKELLNADMRPESKIVDALFKIREDCSGGVDTGSCIQELLEWQRALTLGLGKRKNELLELNQENVSHEQDRDVVRNPPKQLSNPWDVLSDGARSFLVSINITDAEMFLAGKTKHLAEQLVSYRETHNLVPLRGSGAVASVSGWKALVRKAASGLGYHELANLNAGRNAGIKLKRRKRKGDHEEDESVSEEPKTTTNPKADFLSSKSRRLEPPPSAQLYNAMETFSVRKGEFTMRFCGRHKNLSETHFSQHQLEKFFLSTCRSDAAPVTTPVNLFI